MVFFATVVKNMAIIIKTIILKIIIVKIVILIIIVSCTFI